MVLVKILKRRDASSVMVAIILAMIIGQLLSMTTNVPASKIIQSPYGPSAGGPGWKEQYLFPIVWAVLQIVVLEILSWIYIYSSRPIKRKRG
ncbi:hypothetical protein KW794_02190 [Candidatus Saccharibacteria bacterium]|nr:hypothetical protein [Candidatus Saccharibacteria bacterium]